MRALALVAALAAFTPATLGASGVRLHRPRRGFQVRMSSFVVGARAEREVCQLVTLPNTGPVDATELAVAMAGGTNFGSHHFAIFLYTGDHPEAFPADPFDAPGCVSGFDNVVEPILAFVQERRARIRFPRGVGVRLAPHQRVLLDSHYLNGDTAPQSAEVVINFRTTRAGVVQHHARTFELGAARIEVPPGTTGSAGGSWTTTFPMNVISLTSHSHKHTVAATVDLLRSGADVGQLLVTTDYADPVVRRYPIPLRLEPADGFRWQCDYRNDTGHTLQFGRTSDDEMCFALGFFYPDDDAAPLPGGPGCFPQSDALLCFD